MLEFLMTILLLLNRKSNVDNGDIIAALVDGEEATVKRFYKEDGHYRLQPENDFMDPIIVDKCEILGKVVAVVRYL
jgi:repressor LexA